MRHLFPSSVWCAVALSVTLLNSGWATAQSKSATTGGQRPNVVLILADDLGWNDVGYHGSEIPTPNLNRLANHGIRLERFYVQPACSPTRASLMTASNNQRLGIYSPLSKHSPTGLPLSRKLMPEYFKEAGYQTFMVGKWHLGFRQPAYRPSARGFDSFYGNLTGGIGYWDRVHGGGLDWQRNGQSIREDGYVTRLQAAEIERLIDQRDPDTPMFLYASFNAPHLPNEAPLESVQKMQNIEDPLRRVHAAMVSELDQAIGRLVKKLEDEEILDNTLIWFMSDNGGLNVSAMRPSIKTAARIIDRLSFGKSDNLFLEFVRVNALEGRGSNSPYRKGKQSVYEGGVRVPSLLYWRGKLVSKSFSKMITVQDVLPTLLQAAGLYAMQTGIDGQSVWDHFNNKIVDHYTPTDFVTTGMDGQAYYQYPWKLIELSNGDLELYQLELDPTESRNIADTHTNKVAELKQALAALPRAHSVHVSLLKSVFSPDFFGGEETQKPWSEVHE